MIEKIRVADFSPVPFGRYPTDGNFSGQRFRRERLKNAFQNSKNEKIQVDFNGIVPVGSSFLDESFGGLIRDEGMSFEEIWERLEIISDFPIYEIQIKNILQDAEEELKVNNSELG